MKKLLIVLATGFSLTSAMEIEQQSAPQLPPEIWTKIVKKIPHDSTLEDAAKTFLRLRETSKQCTTKHLQITFLDSMNKKFPNQEDEIAYFASKSAPHKVFGETYNLEKNSRSWLKKTIFKKELQKKGAWYSSKLKFDAPLDQELVMNDLWKRMEHERQYLKDNAFKHYAMSSQYTKKTYNIQRYNIMGGALIGANLKETDQVFTALQLAVYYNDCPLVEKLIEHGADVNDAESLYNWGFEEPTITQASTIEMAQLLVKHGAYVKSNLQEIISNLQKYKTENYLELIEYYKDIASKQ